MQLPNYLRLLHRSQVELAQAFRAAPQALVVA
jgi:hypothetical protein